MCSSSNIIFSITLIPLRFQNYFHIYCVSLFSLFLLCSLGSIFQNLIPVLPWSVRSEGPRRQGKKTGYYYYYYYYCYCFGGFLNLHALFTVANAVNIQWKVQKHCWNGFLALLTLLLISSHHHIMSFLWSLPWSRCNFAPPPQLLPTTSSCLPPSVA